MQPSTFDAQIGVAILCGLIIGMERQWRQHPAGLRPHPSRRDPEDPAEPSLFDQVSHLADGGIEALEVPDHERPP